MATRAMGLEVSQAQGGSWVWEVWVSGSSRPFCFRKVPSPPPQEKMKLTQKDPAEFADVSQGLLLDADGAPSQVPGRQERPALSRQGRYLKKFQTMEAGGGGALKKSYKCINRTLHQ